ncbi:l-1-1Bi [Drosophila busckii]|uniref:L-1-1Bi n=1 Tax=Drosophila busckii TaxID=30019 RepID=A0A0M3QZN3_DROBS|nr:myb-binding protein 1A [Drosophila busckii]ALC49679.1 l-1-1Bi [Drosophila busckii]
MRMGKKDKIKNNSAALEPARATFALKTPKDFPASATVKKSKISKHTEDQHEDEKENVQTGANPAKKKNKKRQINDDKESLDEVPESAAVKKSKKSKHNEHQHNGEKENVETGANAGKKKNKKRQINGDKEKEDGLDDVPPKQSKLSTDAATGTKPGSNNLMKLILQTFNNLQKEKNDSKSLKKIITIMQMDGEESVLAAPRAYVLKRLIRATGADDKESVSTNANHLHTILTKVPNIDIMEMLQILKRELPVNAALKTKEDALAAVGQLVVVTSIIQSPYFVEPSEQLITAIYELLMPHLKGREYLVSMCVEIITESLEKLNDKNFKTLVWPMLQKELSKPIQQQTLHTMDLLLSIRLNYPERLKQKVLESMLWPKTAQYNQLFDLYTQRDVVQNLNIYGRFGQLLASKGNATLLTAWQQYVLDKLPIKSSHIKCHIICIFTCLLLHYDDSDEQAAQVLVKIFENEELAGMLVDELEAASKLHTNKTPKAGQLELRSASRKFETALIISMSRQLKQEESKLGILHALLKLRPQLDACTQTPRFCQRLLTALDKDSLNAMLKYYKTQYTSDDEKITKPLRDYWMRQMQYVMLNPKLTKGKKELDFLMLNSIFHLNAEKQPCVRAEAAAFSQQSLPFGEEAFFGVLTHKIDAGPQALHGFSKRLQRIAALLQQHFKETDNIADKLRVTRTPDMLKAWAQVKLELQDIDPENTLALVFNVLILFVGVAMYTASCNISVELLQDILKCKQLAFKPKQKAAKEEELNWQDVLTDALLQLMLQVGGFWRSFVKTIMEATMPQLNGDNLKQILAIYDMKTNPLGKGDGDEDEDEDSEDDEQSESDSDDKQKSKGKKHKIQVEQSDSDDDDEEEESDDDDDDEEADEDATTLEKTRENIRLALVNSGDIDEDDGSSVDWNDVSEDKGKRLNQALEHAFQVMRPQGSDKAKKKRQTKSERIDNTTLLHFRTRVLDLVQVYIKAKANLEEVMDALITIFNVYTYCLSDAKLKSLAQASKKLLRELLNQKIDYKTNKCKDKQIILDTIQHFVKLAEANLNTIENRELSELRDKCFVYLFNQFQETNITSTKMWPVLMELQQDALKRRKTAVTLNTFGALLASPWVGVKELAISFLDILNSENVPNMRRKQILELLIKHVVRINSSLHGTINKFLPKLEAFSTTDSGQLELKKQLVTKLTNASMSFKSKGKADK